MKPCRLGCAIVVLAVSLVGGWKQAEAGPGLFAGGTLPVGDFSDSRKAGFHVGADYTYPLTPMVGIGAWGAYHRLGSQHSIAPHADLYEALAMARLTPPGGWLFLGGVGVTHMRRAAYVGDMDFGEVFPAVSSTDFSVAGGVGFSVTMLRVTALYHNVSTSGRSNSFVTVSAGVGF